MKKDQRPSHAPDQLTIRATHIGVIPASAERTALRATTRTVGLVGWLVSWIGQFVLLAAGWSWNNGDRVEHLWRDTYLAPGLCRGMGWLPGRAGIVLGAINHVRPYRPYREVRRVLEVSSSIATIAQLKTMVRCGGMHIREGGKTTKENHAEKGTKKIRQTYSATTGRAHHPPFPTYLPTAHPIYPSRSSARASWRIAQRDSRTWQPLRSRCLR